MQLPALPDLPQATRSLLEEGERRLRDYQEQHGRRRGFVASDFPAVAQVLALIWNQGLSTGPRLCEWGSGLGIVASTASTLGFEASGIEIQEQLVEWARDLASDFDLSVEFVHGTLVPATSNEPVDSGAHSSFDDETEFDADRYEENRDHDTDEGEPFESESIVEAGFGEVRSDLGDSRDLDEEPPTDFSWWDVDAIDGHAELGCSVADFDVIYAYPWPGEEDWIESLFCRWSALGALLVTHHGVSGTHIQRRTSAGLQSLGWY